MGVFAPHPAVTFETHRSMKKQRETLCKWHYVRIFARSAGFMSRIEGLSVKRQPCIELKFLISFCFCGLWRAPVL